MHALDSTRADFVLPVDHSDCLVEGDADQLSDVSENIYCILSIKATYCFSYS